MNILKYNRKNSSKNEEMITSEAMLKTMTVLFG